MRVAVEIEVGEIRDRFMGASGRDFPRPNETPEALSYLDIHQVGRMKLVLVTEEASFDLCAQCRLKEKLQQG